MSDHYTAVIKISKTEISTPSDRTESYPRNATPKKSDGNRDVQEVASLVIRADSIEALVEKATAHLNLVEE